MVVGPVFVTPEPARTENDELVCSGTAEAVAPASVVSKSAAGTTSTKMPRATPDVLSTRLLRKMETVGDLFMSGPVLFDEAGWIRQVSCLRGAVEMEMRVKLGAGEPLIEPRRPTSVRRGAPGLV